MARTLAGRTLVVGALIAVFACVSGQSASAQQCAGDCNGNGAVTINDIVRALQIALGEAPVTICPAADTDTNGIVSVEEITQATVAALSGCDSGGNLVPRAAGEVTLIIGTAIIAAGDTGTFDVSMDSGGLEVAGIQIDIFYDPLAPIDVPNCVVNPATGKQLNRANLGNRARFLVLSLSDVNPIPDGVLFTCPVNVPLSTPPATYPLTGANEGASDPDGMALTTVSTDGAVVVLPPPPSPTRTATPSPHPPATSTPTVCPPAPAGGCRTAAKSSLNIRNGKMTWRWLDGTSALGDFGYPVAGPTDYTLCLYGTQNSAPYVVTHFEVPGNTMCDGTFCWKPTGLRGFKYTNSTGHPDGVTRVRLRAGSGDAKILVKAIGVGQPAFEPADPNNLISQDPNVIVQLRNDDGICWEAVYPGPAQRSDGGQFKDRF